jgi:hypothetical protein
VNIVDCLRHLNSMTKYPSIDTYHQLDPKNGILQDAALPFTGNVIGTEKINGTNGRIMVFPDGDWIIGSREELLHARGDRITNPALGIATAITSTAEHLAALGTNAVPTVYYGEVYGHGIDGGKEYTRTKGRTGFRLFDVAVLTNFTPMLDWPIEKVASWRHHGGQPFVDENHLHMAAQIAGLELVPRLFTIDSTELPTGLDKMRAFLGEHLPVTRVPLDGVPGNSEGIVLRSSDRAMIAKARFEDYDRTLRRRPQTGQG